MTFAGRGVFRLAGLAMLVSALPACAQDNLDRGKSAQQLFASDCSICHKTPQGLAKGGSGVLGLQGFLREHYTASRETATMLARYLEAAGGPPAADPRKPTRRTAKPSEAKPSEAKPSEAKPSESKPADAKPADKKSADQKPAEAKADAKLEPKSETKPESRPEPKVEAKSESKPESQPEPKVGSSAEIKSGIAVSPAPADQPEKSE